MNKIGTEEQKQTIDAYTKFNQEKDSAIDNFKLRKITIKQRAVELTKAHINYNLGLSKETIGFRYYFVDKYS